MNWRKALAGIVLAAVLGPGAELVVSAATVWDGPSMAFSKPNSVDWTQPENQDRLTPGVWLTRGSLQGLFNIAKETTYMRNSSPADTEWAYGTLDNYASLAYANWETWNGKNPPSMVGRDAVLHLISEDIYLSVKFTAWGLASGSFAYERSAPSAVPESSASLLFLVGLACRSWTRLIRGRISQHRTTTLRRRFCGSI